MLLGLIATMFLSIASCIPDAHGPGNTLSAESAGTLRFRGTVLALDPTPENRALERWVVTMSVDEVSEGAFTGQTFSFMVHSPVKSGLQLGASYTVRAVSTSVGFTVDPYQWTGQVDRAKTDKPIPD